ncbi:hypothetical protein TRVL_08811 [Trypanosoma vivax]|nr:hypothetical protein TRVL_08811 [Trypanosoma vivax]
MALKRPLLRRKRALRENGNLAEMDCYRGRRHLSSPEKEEAGRRRETRAGTKDAPKRGADLVNDCLATNAGNGEGTLQHARRSGGTTGPKAPLSANGRKGRNTHPERSQKNAEKHITSYIRRHFITGTPKREMKWGFMLAGAAFR